MNFSLGVRVRYRDIAGFVNFVCDEYLTICIQQIKPDPLRAVCILVYRDQWNRIQLEKESEK